MVSAFKKYIYIHQKSNATPQRHCNTCRISRNVEILLTD